MHMLITTSHWEATTAVSYMSLQIAAASRSVLRMTGSIVSSCSRAGPCCNTMTSTSGRTTAASKPGNGTERMRLSSCSGDPPQTMPTRSVASVLAKNNRPLLASEAVVLR